MNKLSTNRSWNNVPFTPSKSKIFYGWWILVVGTIGTLASAPGQTIGFSVFTEPLILALKIDRLQLGFAYMIGTLMSACFLIYSGKLYDKFGARIISTICALFLGGILLVLSQLDKITSFANTFFKESYHTTIIIAISAMCFFLLRFLGQGVMTLASRNMIQKWFIKKRGLVNGVAGVFVAFGFSVAPKAMDSLIKLYNWSWAWVIMGIALIIIMTPIAFIFYRDNPEDCDLLPDGETYNEKNQTKENSYTLTEARKTYIFWIYTASLSYGALFITAFTFNIESIFTTAGISRDIGVNSFIYSGSIAILVNILGGYYADKIAMKKILYIYLIGEVFLSLGILFLSESFAVYSIILGNGLAGGLFGILIAISFPKFFGRKHLGAITGACMTCLVVASAVGPLIFALSEKYTGEYVVVTLLMLSIAILLIIGTFLEKKEKEY